MKIKIPIIGDEDIKIELVSASKESRKTGDQIFDLLLSHVDGDIYDQVYKRFIQHTIKHKTNDFNGDYRRMVKILKELKLEKMVDEL